METASEVDGRLKQTEIKTIQKDVGNRQPNKPEKVPTNDYDIPLESLLLVHEASDISMPTTTTTTATTTVSSGAYLNSYVVCRMFWCDEALKSPICWSSNNPCYNFQQIIPIKLTAAFISKMKNNFVVIEVWNKSLSASNDQLLGIVKVPINQFYLSYNDETIANALLKSKFPVVAHEGWLSAVNLRSGQDLGQMRILLALGTHDQVARLLQMKFQNKNKRLIEGNEGASSAATGLLQEVSGKIKHTFDITIECVKDMKLSTDEVWGETDCFVQYNFPEQKHEASDETTKSYFRSKTTLCVPNPVFNHSTHHHFTLSKSVPIQHCLLDTFKTQSKDSDVVQFELWKRYYYPNIRDQLIARACLPVAKLCAMVTMRTVDEVATQQFSLNLSAMNMQETSQTELVEDVGEMNVFVSYKQQPLYDVSSGKAEEKHVVCLSVAVLRGCGLQVSYRKK